MKSVRIMLRGALMTRYTRIAAYLVVFVFTCVFSPCSNSKVLPIRPVTQATPVWCWVAVSEMLLRHYGIPNLNEGGNYQCALIANELEGSCRRFCGNPECIVPAGSVDRIIDAIESYADLASNDSVHAEHEDDALSPDAVVLDIENENPIIAGISPGGNTGGVSAHVALIVGYEREGNMLIVNDPFPFSEARMPNPYLQNGGERRKPGQYRISRENFIDELNWNESIRVESNRSIKELPAEPTEFSFCEAIEKFASDEISFISNQWGVLLSRDGSNSKRLTKKVIDDFQCRVSRDGSDNSQMYTCTKYIDDDDEAMSEFERYERTLKSCFSRVNADRDQKFTELSSDLHTWFFESSGSTTYSVDVSLSESTSSRPNKLELEISEN